MKRIFAFVLAAVLIAGSAAAAPPGPYKLDAKGKCHAANGQFVTGSMCKPAALTKNHCKDPKTHKFVKCTAPGAVPA